MDLIPNLWGLHTLILGTPHRLTILFCIAVENRRPNIFQEWVWLVPSWNISYMDPWCWNIYQHLPHKWPSFVGKYTSTMDPSWVLWHDVGDQPFRQKLGTSWYFMARIMHQPSTESWPTHSTPTVGWTWLWHHGVITAVVIGTPKWKWERWGNWLGNCLNTWSGRKQTANILVNDD